MDCKKCNKTCIKNGFQNNGKQRYYCKNCELHQQKQYRYKAYLKETNRMIYKLLVNSCGITDISRVLEISRNTVRKRILLTSSKTKRPFLLESCQTYEMDELCIKIKGKRQWIIYAINRKTKQVIDYVVGSRTNENLSQVINTILLLHPKRIYTDGLLQYKTLIPKHIHKCVRYQTNRIERYNLNLRTHLKRLNRKTICYSKKIEMLTAILKIYFWDYQLKV